MKHDHKGKISEKFIDKTSVIQTLDIRPGQTTLMLVAAMDTWLKSSLLR